MVNEKNKPKTLQHLYARNHPSSGGTCTAYVPMSTSNRKCSALQERKHYLVWKILPHLLGRGSSAAACIQPHQTPLAVGLTVCLCLTETNGWVLQFRRGFVVRISWVYRPSLVSLRARGSSKGLGCRCACASSTEMPWYFTSHSVSSRSIVS